MSLDLGCVKLWHSLPKKRSADMWGADAWKDASLEEQGAAAYSKAFGRVV